MFEGVAATLGPDRLVGEHWSRGRNQLRSGATTGRRGAHYSAHRSPQLPQDKVTAAQDDQGCAIYSHILSFSVVRSQLGGQRRGVVGLAESPSEPRAQHGLKGHFNLQLLFQPERCYLQKHQGSSEKPSKSMN